MENQCPGSVEVVMLVHVYIGRAKSRRGKVRVSFGGAYCSLLVKCLHFGRQIVRVYRSILRLLAVASLA
jgi:hypothetical protein